MSEGEGFWHLRCGNPDPHDAHNWYNTTPGKSAVGWWTCLGGGTTSGNINPVPLSEDPFPGQVHAAYEEARKLLLKKHKDYGPKNISGAPGGPLNGLRVRMYDKLARLNNLVDTGVDPQNESLRDTLLDLANYALIGILVIDGDWPA